MYCPYLYMHQVVTTTAGVQPCCMSITNEDWRSIDFKKGLDTELHKKMRSEHEQNIWPKECKICQQQEEKSIDSHRQQAINDYGKPKKIYIKYLDIKFTNICNLACRMCKPSDSSQLEKLYKNLIITPNFLSLPPDELHFQEKEKVLYTKVLIKNGLEILKVTGGEPTACKYFMELINWSVDNDYAKNLTIKFTTNATKINLPFIKKLLKFKKVQIVISLDGIDKIYNYIRAYANWKSVKNNIEMLTQYKDIFDISIVMLYQWYNVLDFKNVIDFGTNLGVITKVTTGLKPKGSELDCRNINEEIKNQVFKISQQIKKEYHGEHNLWPTQFHAIQSANNIEKTLNDKFIKKGKELLQTIKIQDQLHQTDYKKYLTPMQIKFLENN